jgi:hypothetical protein
MIVKGADAFERSVLKALAKKGILKSQIVPKGDAKK